MNETALKERLKTIAKEKNISFNEVWKQLLLERFLARLSESKHQDNFIFKGGLLLAQYLTIGRETTDVDFLMKKIKSNAESVETAMKDIVAIDLKDGFSFLWSSLDELSQPHMEYPGYRVSVHATLGKLKDRIQIDIGVGDLVVPVEEDFRLFEYKGKPIFEGEITLMVYPVETIFAEKLETIIFKGATNSRMKDYHDVILMVREKNLLDVKKLPKVVTATFEHRTTELKLPVQFAENEVASLQKLWTAHLRGLGSFKEKLGLPSEFPEVLTEINSWLKKNDIKSKK